MSDPLVYESEAEAVVLGTMFGPGVNKTHVAECIEVLDEKDFNPINRIVFRAIKECFIAGEPLEAPLTIVQRLRLDGTLDEVGSHHLLDLLHWAPSSHSARHHLKTVKWAARLREWQQLQVEDVTSREDAERVAQQAQELLADIKSGSVVLPSPLRAEIEGAMELFEEGARKQAGLSSGLPKFDEVTGGFLPGQYVIVGARTSVGKTSLLVQLTVAAARQGAKALFLSLEMPKRQVTFRIMAQESGVPVQHLVNPEHLRESSWTALSRCAGNIADQGIWIADGAFDIDSLIAKVKRAHAQVGGLDLIAVDYVQLVRGAGKNRTEEVGQVSRGLKALANELGVCVLTASQLSRQHERDNRQPNLSDLRESGSLEHDADVVVLIHRTEEKPIVSTYETDLIVAKNRNGKTGAVKARFDAPLNRFEVA